MEDKTPRILVNPKWLECVAHFGEEVQKEMLWMIYRYDRYGEKAENLSDISYAFYPLIKEEIDYYKTHYKTKSEKCSEAGKKGGRPSKIKKGEKPKTNPLTDTETDACNDECEKGEKGSERVEKGTKSLSILNTQYSTTSKEVERPRAREEAPGSVEEVAKKFVEDFPILAESYRKELGGITEREFLRMMGDVLIAWLGNGWQLDYIRAGAHQYSAKMLRGWLRKQLQIESESAAQGVPKSRDQQRIELLSWAAEGLRQAVNGELDEEFSEQPY